nr:MAG TPA: helix-turn-helix domain protein [Caudoviricetes sp.]
MKKLDIKRALAEHNMSQIDLCQKIGVAQQNMSAIVRSGNPTVAKLMQIAEGIGCDITDLFYPDPAEEAEEAERKKKEMEEEIEKNMKPLGMDVMKQIAGRVPDVIGGNNGGGVDWTTVENAENGGEMEQQMIQTSTFCPHCGKKVRVGVVLLPDE